MGKKGYNEFQRKKYLKNMDRIYIQFVSFVFGLFLTVFIGILLGIFTDFGNNQSVNPYMYYNPDISSNMNKTISMVKVVLFIFLPFFGGIKYSSRHLTNKTIKKRMDEHFNEISTT